MSTRRRILVRGAAAALSACMPAWPRAAEADWPSRPVRIIVVYPPGGVSDGVARLLAEGLADRLGVPVIVENRPGAGGAVGMELLARAQPDGYTLAFSAVTPLTLRPHFEKVPYRPLHDFAPVIPVMSTPALLVGTPAFTGHDIGDVIAQARARPGELRWATTGIATTGHMVLAQVCLAAGISVTHVPYNGGGRQVLDALGGQFELLSTNVAPDQIAYVREGRLKALAVGAPSQLAVLPGVPTFADAGLPSANVWSVFGLFGTAGTPPERIARLNAIVSELLADNALAARLRAADILPGGGAPREFAREIAAQWARNRRMRSAR